MTKNILKPLALAAVVTSAFAGASSAQAMDVTCVVQQVGIHGGGTPDARAVVRCMTPTSGVQWLAVALSSPMADRFLNVMNSAFLSGRTVSAWAPAQGTGCFNDCRLVTQFSVWK